MNADRVWIDMSSLTRIVIYDTIDGRWDSLPIIQTYVKQKLGEAPELKEKVVPKAKVASPMTPAVTKPVVVTDPHVSAVEGERWDPNRQLDKLKTGVLNRLYEQQKLVSPAPSESLVRPDKTSDVDATDGNNP
jgi:hypothetical protein